MSTRQNRTQLSFNPTCPSGGSWYACGSTFLGCCTSNACSPNGCSDGSLRPVAFDADQFQKFPDASCGSGAKFWTCGFGPTFWGCCKSNPCAAGAVCPDGDLAGAFVGSPAQEVYYIAGGSASAATTTRKPGSSTSGSSVETSQTLGTSARTSSSSVTGATPSSSATAAASSSHPASHTAAIAGGAGGGGVVAALLAGWLLYYLCYRRTRKNHNDSPDQRHSVATTAEKPDTPAIPQGHDCAPPGYIYPSPNSTPNSSPYQRYDPRAYTYHHASASPTGWKPQHSHGASELSGESVWRGELESPVPLPKVGGPPQSSEATWSGYENGGGWGNALVVGMRGAGGRDPV